MVSRAVLSSFVLSTVATPGLAQEMPDLARALLEAAAETGEADQVYAVANAVKEVFPDYSEAIDQEADNMASALTPPEPVAPPVPPEAPQEPSQPGGILGLGQWTGTFGAGATLATGNSENIAAGLSIDAKRATGKLTHNVKAGIDLASASGVRTQKRWYGSYQLDINFSERTYAYSRFSYDEDEFSGFDYRLFGGAGLGHFLYKSEPFTWKIEGGPGYRFSPIDDTRETESEFALYASTEVDWQIRDGVLFEQNVNATWTDPTSTIESLTALTTTLTNTLSTSLSYRVRYETNPPDGRENTDTLLKASVNYGF